MITLTAKIELSGVEGNIISAATPSLLSETKTTEVNSFIIGESRLGEGAVFGSASSGAKTEIVINYRNLISLESSIFDRSDIKLPSWGIISNGGRLEFNDPFGDIKALAERNLLTNNQVATLYLTDTISGYKRRYPSWLTSEWSYDSDNKVVTLRLTDGLEKLQEINFNGLELEYNTINAMSLLNKLQPPIQNAGFMLSNYYWDAKTIDVLNNTKIKYPYLLNGTLWSQLQKICEICGLYVYCHSKMRGVLILSHEFRG